MLEDTPTGGLLFAQGEVWRWYISQNPQKLATLPDTLLPPQQMCRRGSEVWFATQSNSWSNVNIWRAGTVVTKVAEIPNSNSLNRNISLHSAGPGVLCFSQISGSNLAFSPGANRMPLPARLDYLLPDRVSSSYSLPGLTSVTPLGTDRLMLAGGGSWVLPLVWEPTLISAWTSAHGLTGANAEPGADSDGDGRTNFQEMLWDTNPTLADTAPPMLRGL